MKRLVIGLAIIAVVFGAYSVLSKHAAALSIFGFNLSFSSSQTTTTTNNGKSTTMHNSSSFHYDSSKDGNSNPCHKFSGKEYDACSAYIANVIGDLVPYYSFVHSDESFMQQFATSQLSEGFSGQAQRETQQITSQWPSGDLNISAPKIKFESINLNENTATLHTEENWTVKTDSGQILYSENGKQHTITTQQMPNDALHQWVVTEIH